MYFRTKTVKGTPVVQLVESFRNPEGQPRQRILASLGDARLPDAEKNGIARAVEDHLLGKPPLPIDAPLSQEAASWVTRILQLLGRSKAAKPAATDKIDGVLLDKIQTENVVQFGPQCVAMAAWNALGLTGLLEQAGLNPAQAATAQLMVANRLIEPLSEWALIDWSHRTALPEMLGIRITKTTKDRLYQTSDLILSHRKDLEQKLRHREAELFDCKRSIILYDMTNTHFEGLCAKNPKARHGKNKQKRNDCRQVAVGMAFDERGLALAHDVFEGNIAETKTLATMLDRLDLHKDTTQKPVVVLDAGFASAANIALLKERGYSYLINITRDRRRKYAEQFAQDGFEALPGRKPEMQVEVRRITDPEDAQSRLILCRSAQRRAKETAMLSKAETRFLSDFEALRKLIAGGKLKKPDLIERRIGRLEKKHPRAARYYTLRHATAEGLTAQRDDDKHGQASEALGNYVLKTDHTLDAEQTWSLYMTLLQAEEGFCALKSTLGMRPNYHQLEGREDGHIFISVLAYHLLTWVREKLRDQGDLRDWKTLRRLLSTHMLATTSLTLEDGRVLHLRKPTVPDAEQATVYQRLGIDWKAAFPAQKTWAKGE